LVSGQRFSFLSLIFSLAFIFQSCDKQEQIIGVDPALSQFIDAYTSGLI
jgi:hypothetical protein